MFSIFYQSKNSFEGQLPDERTLTVLRAHWLTLLGQAIIMAIIGITPVILYVITAGFLSKNGIAALYWFFASIYLLFWWFKIFHTIFLYLLNIWVVTDHRIIDTEQHGFFNRSVSELNILNVQDVTVEIKGFFQTLLNFGNIEVQTASEEKKFFFRSMPNPTIAKNLIMQAHNDFLSAHPDKKELSV